MENIAGSLREIALGLGECFLEVGVTNLTPCTLFRYESGSMRVAFFSTASLFCIDVEALQHPVCINRELEHFISAVFAAPEVRVNFRVA